MRKRDRSQAICLQEVKIHVMIGGMIRGETIMKKNDYILAAIVLIAAAVFGIWTYGSMNSGHYVIVEVNGEEYGSYDLDDDQVIEIGETNTLEIKDGKASMIHADCPDQLCVHMTAISRSHELIVCLPNKVTVEAFEK